MYNSPALVDIAINIEVPSKKRVTNIDINFLIFILAFPVFRFIEIYRIWLYYIYVFFYKSEKCSGKLF